MTLLQAGIACWLERQTRDRKVRQTGIACWLERQTCGWKVANSNPSRSGGRFFFSRVNFVCWFIFAVHSTPVLLQQHVKKNPSHSAKSAGGRLHLNTHTPLTQQSWSGLTKPLSRHSVGIYPETSSHTTHQGTHGYTPVSYTHLTLPTRRTV